jgi:hypothetical protein
LTENVYLSYAMKVRNDLLSDSTPDATEIRNVILVLSASRGGSSLLYEVLTDSTDVLCLAGEHVPFYKLHGFDARHSPDHSDRLGPVDPLAVVELGRTLMSEVRVGQATNSLREPGFASQLAFRLALQWPQLGLSAENLLRRIDLARHEYGGQDPSEFMAYLLGSMTGVDPWYYDLAAAHVTRWWRKDPPSGPPNPVYCLEEPPFVVPRPHRMPDVDEIRTKPLVLKAPLDAYRLDLVRSLFPNARFTVVHLTRNPAASINGLYDGWRDRGFFSHNLGASGLPLAIPGYSGEHAWSRNWWNFDLPPGWQELATAPLEQVCAFQWRSVHEHILRGLEQPWHSAEIRVRFEDFVGSADQRAKVITAIREAAGVPDPARHDVATRPMRPIMVTKPPSEHRWLANGDVVLRAAKQPSVVEIADVFGYQLEAV